MTRRIAIIVALIVLGGGSALAGYAIVEHRNPVSAITQITQIFVPPPQQVFGSQNLLVLIEGLDYDYTAKDEEFSTNSRSDAIWAVNLDFANKRIYQLSIPRDMVATLPNGTQGKINEAQSDGGVTEAKSVIANWLGIPGFDRYVVLRIDATKEFIAAIGGIDVDVKSSDCFQLQDRLYRRDAQLRRYLGAPAHPSEGRHAASQRRASRRVHALPARLVQRPLPHHAPTASTSRARR